MFWILTAILLLSLLIGIVYPLAAIILFKCLSIASGKKTTIKQIMSTIGY